MRDRTPGRHGAREKKKTKKAILGDQRPRNFRLIGSHLNRGFEDLDSAFKVEKVERRVHLTPPKTLVTEHACVAKNSAYVHCPP
ncbi:MAG: hypothetical protein EB069_10510 [Actinobacteria bacterium]|nr:hypothetical protein [Actinomycetota bacterium]